MKITIPTKEVGRYVRLGERSGKMVIESSNNRKFRKRDISVHPLRVDKVSLDDAVLAIVTKY